MPTSPMPDSRAFSSTGWRPVIGFEPSRTRLLSQSYQPPGVIAIIARSYQPVLAAVRSTFSALRWVLRPRCTTLPACLASLELPGRLPHSRSAKGCRTPSGSRRPRDRREAPRGSRRASGPRTWQPAWPAWTVMRWFGSASRSAGRLRDQEDAIAHLANEGREVLLGVAVVAPVAHVEDVDPGVVRRIRGASSFRRNSASEAPHPNTRRLALKPVRPSLR